MIIVLDDSPERIKWFRSQFPAMRHASTPPEALKILRSVDRFDAIYLDHDLGGPFKRGPEGDGIDVAKAMAEEGLHTDTPVIIHSLNVLGSLAMYNALKGTHQDVKMISYLKLRGIKEC